MTADRLRLFVLTSLPALHLDRGSGPTGIAAARSGGKRAWPLIMTWCPDKRAVNTCDGGHPQCVGRADVAQWPRQARSASVGCAGQVTQSATNTLGCIAGKAGLVRLWWAPQVWRAKIGSQDSSNGTGNLRTRSCPDELALHPQLPA